VSVTKIKTSKKKFIQGREEIIGTAVIHEDFFSEHLDNKRNIIVWTPPAYKRQKHTDKFYPVLYMHDGQNVFDPKTSFAGKDWRVDETIVRLIRNRKIKEVIVVGIYNSPDRIEEYSYSEKGRKYLRFIVEELKPFIDKNYRTLPGRENTAIMGSSMGGLISFVAGWIYDEVFSMVGALSSSFYYDNEKVFELIENFKGPRKKVKFYIDHGEDGLIRGQKMFCKLTQMGYVIGKDIDYYYAPGAEHNESAWAERLERPLLFFFGKK
jgi:predicted alpha/beta superfamily hydrolase